MRGVDAMEVGFVYRTDGFPIKDYLFPYLV